MSGFHFTQEQEPMTYSFTTANDASSQYARNPTLWNITKCRNELKYKNGAFYGHSCRSDIIDVRTNTLPHRDSTESDQWKLPPSKINMKSNLSFKNE